MFHGAKFGKINLYKKSRNWNTWYKSVMRVFLSSPVVETLHFHCRGHGLDS